MKSFLDFGTKDLDLKKKFFINFFFLLFVSVLSYAYGDLYLSKFPNFVDSNNQIIIKNFQFDYGELLYNLYNYNEYNQLKHDTTFHLLRLPLLPSFTNFLLKISLNFYVFIIIKNIIIFFILNLSILYFTSNYDLKVKHYLFILLIFFYNPYNLHVLLNFNFADGYNALLLCIFFFMILINNRKSIIAGSVCICLLYLSKSFLFLFCIFYPIFDYGFKFFIYKKYYNTFSKTRFFILISGTLLALLGWGTFGKINANYFPFGSNTSSYNSYALSSMLNKDFKNYYPKKSVDLMLDDTIFDDVKFENEKDFYDFFKNKNKIYLKENLVDYISDMKIKVNFILFSLIKDSQFTDDSSKLRYSNFFNKPLLITSILFSFYLFLKKKDQLSFQFLLIMILYITPLILGWATNKHLVSIFILSKIYLFLIYVRKNQSNFFIR